MIQNFNKACIAGCERLAAWADLLDTINVFPVADGDTGRNLLLTMLPLRALANNREAIIEKILLNARGNSGNIAAQFLSEFLKVHSYADFPKQVACGREKAWKAVDSPQSGTMLTVFDFLAEKMTADITTQQNWEIPLIDHLQQAVLETPQIMQKLQNAGVVDSGALGMFIFFEGFFFTLTGNMEHSIPATKRFSNYINVKPSFEETSSEGFCVDIVIQLAPEKQQKLESINSLGKSVVIIQEDQYTKIHLHTHDLERTKKQLEDFGTITKWTTDNIDEQVKNFNKIIGTQPVHIMTDAAGSLTRDDARHLGFTLLSSYINFPDKSVTETFCSPEEIYTLMRNGVKLATAQASDFERNQYYTSILSQYGKVIYICVGSAFTGNFQYAHHWKKQNDPNDNLLVIDSQAASGKLAIIVLNAIQKLNSDVPAADLPKIIQESLAKAEEFLFLNKLEYLARGGRLSKTKAFFGDLLHKKPVVTPTAEGAAKAGITKDNSEQVAFALKKLKSALSPDSTSLILLEYTDNKEWVEKHVVAAIKKQHPHAEIKLQPLSLTTGIHTGPGTWGIAFLRN